MTSLLLIQGGWFLLCVVAWFAGQDVERRRVLRYLRARRANVLADRIQVKRHLVNDWQGREIDRWAHEFEGETYRKPTVEETEAFLRGETNGVPTREENS